MTNDPLLIIYGGKKVFFPRFCLHHCRFKGKNGREIYAGHLIEQKCTKEEIHLDTPAFAFPAWLLY